ncbi:MAG: inositol monophosphatase [Calditrichaeota bacterium]|nr:MAG: inositol monophosphatase [Calditrichota bacterium]
MDFRKDLNQIYSVCLEATRTAGKILKDSYGEVKTIDFKGSIDIVTDVDKKAEDEIIKIIKSHFPEHTILAEESGLSDKHSKVKWIIDPLDGTTNFSHGYKCFSVSVAVEIEGEVVVGAVFDPMADELFSAQKDKDAFLNGEKINVSEVKTLKHSLLCTGFYYNVEGKNFAENIEMFKAFSKRAQAVRRDGSAALDLCYVACGRFEAFWEMDLKAWDIAAGSLIVKEAGGRLSDYSGNVFSIYKEEVLVSNEKIFSEMLEVLKPFRS